MFEDDFPFPKVGYVNFLEGMFLCLPLTWGKDPILTNVFPVIWPDSFPLYKTKLGHEWTKTWWHAAWPFWFKWLNVFVWHFGLAIMDRTVTFSAKMKPFLCKKSGFEMVSTDWNVGFPFETSWQLRFWMHLQKWCSTGFNSAMEPLGHLRSLGFSATCNPADGPTSLCLMRTSMEPDTGPGEVGPMLGTTRGGIKAFINRRAKINGTSPRTCDNVWIYTLNISHGYRKVVV